MQTSVHYLISTALLLKFAVNLKIYIETFLSLSFLLLAQLISVTTVFVCIKIWLQRSVSQNFI